MLLLDRKIWHQRRKGRIVAGQGIWKIRDKGILDSELSVNDPADEQKAYSAKKVFQYIKHKLRKGLAVSKQSIERGYEQRAKKHNPSGNKWWQHSSLIGDPLRAHNFKCTHIYSELWDNDGNLLNKGAGPLQITYKSEFEARNVVIRDRMMVKWKIQCKREFPDGSPPLCKTEQEWLEFKPTIKQACSNPACLGICCIKEETRKVHCWSIFTLAYLLSVNIDHGW